MADSHRRVNASVSIPAQPNQVPALLAVRGCAEPHQILQVLARIQELMWCRLR